MSKYIDSEKLIAEIQRRKNESRELAQEHKNSSLGNAAQTMANEDEEILSLIDSLQQEQPSLPSGLDDAAEKYSENILANNEDLQDAIEDAFKAGAEWMAGQGDTVEGVLKAGDPGYPDVHMGEQYSIEHILRKPGGIEPGEKVIVQIRKK